MNHETVPRDLEEKNNCWQHDTPFHEKRKTKGCNRCLEFKHSGRQWCLQPKPRFQFN